MPDWIVYGLFPLYLALAVALLLYGVVAGLRHVPVSYDVLREAEQVAAQAWRQQAVSDEPE